MTVAGRHCRPSVPVWQLPVCRPPQPDAQQGGHTPAGSLDAELRAWLRDSEEQFSRMAAHLRGWHEARVRHLEAAAAAARATLWWPFTQHTSVRTCAEKPVAVAETAVRAGSCSCQVLSSFNAQGTSYLTKLAQHSSWLTNAGGGGQRCHGDRLAVRRGLCRICVSHG